MANTFKFGNGNWAVKKDSVLAYSDTNDNFKPLPFDFTRDSTATYVDSDGLIKTASSGEARIDYLGNTNGHLLLEPSRTNSLPYSNLFTYAGWSKAGSGTGSAPTVTGDYAISPDGSQNASRLQLDKGSGTTTGDFSYMYETISSVGTGSISIWMKSNDSNTYQVALRMINFTVCDVTPEWQRFEFNNQSSTNEIQIMLRGTYGTSDDADILIYGAQLEAGSYATSYIPTNGETNGVTRAADSANQTPVSGIIGQTEGTLFLEFEDKDYSFSSIARGLSISDGTFTNRIYISQLTSGAIYVYSTGGAELQSTPLASGGVLKVALAYKANDYALYVNGTSVATDTSATVPACNKLYLGQETGLTEKCLNKPYREVKLYDTRLSNAELATLTT